MTKSMHAAPHQLTMRVVLAALCGLVSACAAITSTMTVEESVVRSWVERGAASQHEATWRLETDELRLLLSGRARATCSVRTYENVRRTEIVDRSFAKGGTMGSTQWTLGGLGAVAGGVALFLSSGQSDRVNYDDEGEKQMSDEDAMLAVGGLLSAIGVGSLGAAIGNTIRVRDSRRSLPHIDRLVGSETEICVDEPIRYQSIWLRVAERSELVGSTDQYGLLQTHLSEAIPIRSFVALGSPTTASLWTEGERVANVSLLPLLEYYAQLSWPEAQTIDTIESYQQFIRAFDSTHAAGLARARIRAIEDEAEVRSRTAAANLAWLNTDSSDPAAVADFIVAHPGAAEATDARVRLVQMTTGSGNFQAASELIDIFEAEDPSFATSAQGLLAEIEREIERGREEERESRRRGEAALAEAAELLIGCRDDHCSSGNARIADDVRARLRVAERAGINTTDVREMSQQRCMCD